MGFQLSKRSLGLVVLLLLATALVMTGTVMGIIPDLIRLILSLGVLVSAGLDWRAWKRRDRP